jgi:hypothetical protein
MRNVKLHSFSAMMMKKLISQVCFKRALNVCFLILFDFCEMEIHYDDDDDCDFMEIEAHPASAN